MTDVQLAAEIVSRIPAMAQDSVLNNETTVLNLIRQCYPPVTARNLPEPGPECPRGIHAVVIEGVCLDCGAKVGV